jgi:hypothetical protein
MTLTVPNDKLMYDLDALNAWAEEHMRTHVNRFGDVGCDFTIGPRSDPQVERWWIVPRNPTRNVYLHRFNRSDDDRAPHDHPGDNTSWTLRGRCFEHLQDGKVAERRPGDVTSRKAIEAHWIEIAEGEEMISLFFMGPIERDWGFYCPQGWKHWEAFVKRVPGGNEIGVGCGEP